jgi:hypothetical protein
VEHTAVASSLVSVADVERSIGFYRDIFGCEVTVRDPEAALLLSPQGSQMYLIEKGVEQCTPRVVSGCSTSCGRPTVKEGWRTSSRRCRPMRAIPLRT